MKYTAKIKSISLNISTRKILQVTFSDECGFSYPNRLFRINISGVQYGGSNCEVDTLTVGRIIGFNEILPLDIIDSCIILSDGVREVDEEGNLIKW